MALIIMILVLAFIGNIVALGVSAILGSVLWTAFLLRLPLVVFMAYMRSVMLAMRDFGNITKCRK